ncbi:MAG: Sortase family protein [Parcubacteria group bacterium ADurb.Bin247]|jgi:LPXTG-site transpeptidase (sortase) family protein|nr:MAG: Sortase family protein [Parcubacteria group bacterium ADurb.Bin247]HQB85169.1 sortase [Candidatus Pacearchaeota archaeon]
MHNSRINTLLKMFLLVFVVNIIVLNWNDISWLFNRNYAIEGIESIIKEKEEVIYYDKENSIEIEAIDIIAPLIIPDNESDDAIYNALKRGVSHFPGSSLPGEGGQVIILGHSAPPGWPNINYDWVFSKAETLELGEEIKIYFNNKLYTYEITDSIILEVGEDVPKYDSGEEEIILLSCWPPGKNIKRLGIRGVLK